MAEAFANYYGKGKVEALSAGTMPSKEVNPLVVKVMQEVGIDISKNKPKIIRTEMIEEADVGIIMGCSAQGFCPALLLHKIIDWGIEDPKDKPIEEVRQIRDEIKTKVITLTNKIS